MIVKVHNPRTLRPRQEDHKFKTNVSNITGHCLQKRTMYYVAGKMAKQTQTYFINIIIKYK